MSGSTINVVAELPPAIFVENVEKSFRQSCISKSKHKLILHNVNLTIQRATICGLLGPSGCGKTTLLHCIMKQTSINMGQIMIYGHPSGSPESGIPGRRVGYMPQDIALSGELTIGETINFYGVLMGLKSTDIKVKLEFYTELLQLPGCDRFINTLSGGQQRRLSMAASLIHTPEIVILDEPTVGVDPIIRKRIWQHLHDMTINDNQTVLITTHYIEEATMAHKVGMMYDGTIIYEGSPQDAIQLYSSSCLEDAFRLMCVQCERLQKESTKLECEARTNDTHFNGVNNSLYTCNSKHATTKKTARSATSRYLKNNACMCLGGPLKFNRLRALTSSNLRKSYRHLGSLLVHILAPCAIMITFQLTFGRFPSNISMGVYNEDSQELGTLFLSNVDSENLNLRYYTTYEEGYEAVRNGKTWGLIHVHSNFTDSLVSKFLGNPEEVNNSVSNTEGSIELAMDLTCHPITVAVYDSLINAFTSFGQSQFQEAGLEPALVTPPILFHYDIHKQDVHGLMGFVAPGIILWYIDDQLQIPAVLMTQPNLGTCGFGLYFLSMGSCILSILNDKAIGQLSRNRVLGVTEIELILSNLLTFGVGTCLQAIVYMLMTFWILEFECQGSLGLLFTLTLLHGLCGIAFALFVSIFCTSEFTANTLAFGVGFMPSVCLSGSMWPISCIPHYLREVFHLLPQTFTVAAFRAVMNRGWDITYPVILYGFLVNVLWITMFLLLSANLLRLRKS